MNRGWTDIVPPFTYRKDVPYFQMLVPTIDTVRFSYLLDACLDVGRSVLFTGVTGVGKSVITVDALEALREKKNLVPYTINFSAQTQVCASIVSCQRQRRAEVASCATCLSSSGATVGP